MNIGFIGLGKLGMPCAEEMAKKHHVTGYDIQSMESQVVTIVESIEKCVVNKEFVFLAVPTPHENEYDGSFPVSHLEPKDFSYDIMKVVVEEANRFMNHDQTLVIISTVLPGTIDEQIKILVDNTNLIYNPYLIAMGSVAYDMLNPEMIIIGAENGAQNEKAKKLATFYQTIMQNQPNYIIGTWSEAECIKIFYNTFISTKIGFVNMIQDVAMKQKNINVDVVTNALSNACDRIVSSKYMIAGMGDGGPCHPRDNIALRYLTQKLDLGYDMFESLINAREIQAKNIALELIKHATDKDLPIVIHGKTYKPGVPYIDGSYSILIGHYCEQLKYQINYVDPQTQDCFNKNIPAVHLLAHNFNVSYGNSNYQTGIYYKILPGSVVIDPWRKYYNDDKTITIIHYGNTNNES